MSAPQKFTNPRSTPVKTKDTRENWEKRMQLSGFMFEGILGHEACDKAHGGYKLLTKWPTDPPRRRDPRRRTP
jgi:hypothetical protein